MAEPEKSHAIVAPELPQFLAQLFKELDDDGRSITAFHFEDCEFVVGGHTFEGHAGVSGLYADGLERLYSAERWRTHGAAHVRQPAGCRIKSGSHLLILAAAAIGTSPAIAQLAPNARTYGMSIRVHLK